MEIVNELVGNNIIVIYSSTLNKSHLERGNDMRKERLEFIDNEHRDHFVSDIT